MALFVHVTAQKNARAIRRAGIKVAPVNHLIPQGIFALPVLPNFFISHQWVRELKRNGQRQMCGVYFRLADDEQVWVGRYNQPHSQMTAAAAAAHLLCLEDAQGYEVIIPRAIEPKAIVRIRELPHIGWRYFPSAHKRRPCGCPACLARGEIKSQRIRRAYEAE